jgi:hypothetical protein
MFGDDWMENLDKRLKEQRDEFDRRAADMPPLPTPGDKLVLHAGLLNRGHMWIRIEAVCLAVADNSVKVEITDGYHTKDTLWVHPAVIVDIVKQAAS